MPKDIPDAPPRPPTHERAATFSRVKESRNNHVARSNSSDVSHSRRSRSVDQRPIPSKTPPPPSPMKGDFQTPSRGLPPLPRTPAPLSPIRRDDFDESNRGTPIPPKTPPTQSPFRSQNFDNSTRGSPLPPKTPPPPSPTKGFGSPLKHHPRSATSSGDFQSSDKSMDHKRSRSFNPRRGDGALKVDIKDKNTVDITDTSRMDSALEKQPGEISSSRPPRPPTFSPKASPSRSTSQKKRNTSSSQNLKRLEKNEPEEMSYPALEVMTDRDRLMEKKNRKKESPHEQRGRSRVKKTLAANEADGEGEPVQEEIDDGSLTVADRMFRKFERRVESFLDHIINVRIHFADTFRPNIKVLQPVVKVHFIDSVTGQYLMKSERTRPVTTQMEGDNIDYIMPILSKVLFLSLMLSAIQLS